MPKIIIIFIFVLLFTTSCSNDYVASKTNTNNLSLETNYGDKSGYFLIDLKGEVAHPNLYVVKEGSYLYELIEMAGGLTNNADDSMINLASILEDNQMIIIPSKRKGDVSNKININTCSKEELLTLTGIGSSKADNIINYRKSNGLFKTIDEIKKVNGIGEELFNKIKEEICV